jgi:hypothetical protein
VAGHGGFLLFAFLGGDVNKDFYDYYVSPYGDKRRCLYHQNDDGSMRIVFDEALVDGEFFPSDYFEYFDEQDGGRSRVHMIDGVAGEKEDANFADPFASSYDVAAYNERGQRVLTHYEDGHEINEQVIADPDIALMRDYTYKDGSLVSHLRHNRLAEQNSSKKEENKPMEQTIEEKPITKEQQWLSRTMKKKARRLMNAALPSLRSSRKRMAYYAAATSRFTLRWRPMAFIRVYRFRVIPILCTARIISRLRLMARA